jgi:hypothetical protein
MKTWVAAISLGVATSLAGSAVADDDEGGHDSQKRAFRARLRGVNEVPAVSTAAEGFFFAIVNKDETQITYWLSFSDLTADVSQAHIHFGQTHTNGGIIVWLCEGTSTSPTESTPACGGPRTTTTPITGVLTSAEVIAGAGGQGIAATEFAELLAALRAGAAYANVHTFTSATTPPGQHFPGGEIRGQVF